MAPNKKPHDCRQKNLLPPRCRALQSIDCRLVEMILAPILPDLYAARSAPDWLVSPHDDAVAQLKQRLAS
jgi:hypothetical protein